MDNSEREENDKKWMMIQRLLLVFFADYTNEDLEDLHRKFENWVHNKTEVELADIFDDEDDSEVKKNYKNMDTGETLHSEEDIIRSMFKDKD
tara:strand:- start:152 stop:427 length:276 start_codon:yes stop_codon:yes gene_type:complete